MVVFSPGPQCPIRRRYLTELDGMADEFGRRGVGVIVASSDTPERAEGARTIWVCSI